MCASECVNVLTMRVSAVVSWLHQLGLRLWQTVTVRGSSVKSASMQRKLRV